MPVEDRAENRRLIDELGRETSPGHRLHAVPYRAVARATGSDDAMFEIGHAGPGYAIVHLTFQRERDPRWPRTEIYATWPEAVGAAAAIALGETTTGLTRYWVEFEMPEKDEPQRAVHLDDCLRIISASLLDGQSPPPLRQAIADVKMSQVDVDPSHIGVVVWRGIWFPPLNRAEPYRD